MVQQPKKKAPALLPNYTSLHRFRYRALDGLRTLPPAGYVLVDHLIDLLGYHLFREIYPKTTEDFSKVGNYEDIPFEGANGRNSEHVWPSLTHTGGPGVAYLTLQHFEQRENKGSYVVEPSVFAFRSEVWKNILLWLRSGTLSAYELSADGRCLVIPKKERGLLAFQSEHILRTGSAWRVGGHGFGHRMLVCFRLGNVKSLIQKQTSTKGLLKVRPPKLSEEEAIELLVDLGEFCQLFYQPISEPCGPDIIRYCFGAELKFPSKMRPVFKAVKAQVGPRGFCEAGEKHNFSDWQETEKRKLKDKYIQYRDLCASGIIQRVNAFNYAKEPNPSDVVELADHALIHLLGQIGPDDEKPSSRRKSISKH